VEWISNPRTQSLGQEGGIDGDVHRRRGERSSNPRCHLEMRREFRRRWRGLAEAPGLSRQDKPVQRAPSGLAGAESAAESPGEVFGGEGAIGRV
jgi:hypothetical protein